MRNNLIEFLFGAGNDKCESNNSELGEQIVALFEEAAKAEADDSFEVVDKKPLAAALKSFDIEADIVDGTQWCEIHCSEDAEYHRICLALGTPDAMHRLAEMGWVMVKCGDIAMSNEKPDYKIGFIEVQTTSGNDFKAKKADDKPEDLEDIRKDAQEADTADFERADSNPVEDTDEEGGKQRAGIGKASDGKDPEGKVKGGSKKVSEAARATVDKMLEAPSLQEMTTAGAIPAFPDSGKPLQRKRSKPFGAKGVTKLHKRI